tara:strand:+ start:378 stop:1142 length:765 start_codon:yes stop_codon:yes gene_type:complete
MKTLKKLRSLIIDDELHARVLLQTLIEENCPQVDVIGEADTVDSAIEKIELLDPDLIFLDIKIKNKTGFEILENLKNLKSQVIFTTAYSEFAIKAFEYSALHYLLKPINVEQLEKAVEKALAKRVGFETKEFLNLMNKFKEIHEERISLPNRSGEEYVLIKDIVCCMASGSYTEIYFLDGKQKLISKPLGYLEKKLNPKLFLRTHKKYLVNLQSVIGLEKGRTAILSLKGGLKIDVSITYREQLMDRLKEHITF